MPTADHAAPDAPLGEEMLTRLEHLDTAALSDALYSLALGGVLPGIAARVRGAVCVGPAYTVRYRPARRRRGSAMRRTASTMCPPDRSSFPTTAAAGMHHQGRAADCCGHRERPRVAPEAR